MFYITQEDAVKFWNYLEHEVNEWEASTRMAEDLAKRQGLDSFALQWKATLDAKEMAIADLRGHIQLARNSADSYSGQPMVVAAIDGLLRATLGKSSNSTSFTAAALILDMADEMKRKAVSEIFSFSIKEMTAEKTAELVAS